MILRAIILIGWKDTETPGPNPVESIYCGNDGVELDKAHKAALESGNYVAFRKIVNPSGIPMPVTIDPAPKPPVFHKPEVSEFEPSLDKRLAKAKAEETEKRKLAAEKRAAEDKANAEKQAIADAAEKSAKAFKALNSKAKESLLSDVVEFNESAQDEKKITLAPDAKKSDIVAALLVAQGFTVPENKN